MKPKAQQHAHFSILKSVQVSSISLVSSFAKGSEGY